MQADLARRVATPCSVHAAALAGFLDDRRHGRVGATTAVFDPGGPGALLLEGGHSPYTGGGLGPGEAIPVLLGRVFAYTPAALELARLADRRAQDLGRARAAALHGKRRAGALRRGEAGAGHSGSSKPDGRAADRGDPPPARPPLSLVCRRAPAIASSTIVIPEEPAIKVARSREGNYRTGLRRCQGAIERG